MKYVALYGSAIVAVAITGCTSYQGMEIEDYPVKTSAVANLRDAAGRSMGTATLAQSGDSLRLTVKGANLPSGIHGIHIHQAGLCETPDFASAGAHWNPSGRQHGKDNPAGMHSGDIPNILIDTNGQGTLEYRIPDARLSNGSSALLDNDGAALVIHSMADDYRSEPSGNSGIRIACGIFR